MRSARARWQEATDRQQLCRVVYVPGRPSFARLPGTIYKAPVF